MQNKNRDIKDFSEWQLQSEMGTIVSFLLLLKKNARGMIFLTIYLLLKFSWYQYYWIIIGWIVLFAIIGVFAYLTYKNTQYRIDIDRNEFILKKGIVNKSQHIIQLENIIQVNIDQSFIQRLAGVYSIEIETAGSGKNEATIEALDKEVAFQLKESLTLEKLTTDWNANVENTIESNFHKRDISYVTLNIKPLQLIKYSFTADYARSVLILLGISISFLSRILDYVGQFYNYEEKIEDVIYGSYESQFLFLIGLGLVLIAIFFNGIRNVLTFFQMKLKLDEQSTWISYGLLARKNTVLQNNRTQIFTIKKNYLQHLLNVEKVDIEQISSNIETDKKAKIKIVGIQPEQTKFLFEHVLKETYNKPPLYLKSNIRWIILPLLILLLIPILIYSLLLGLEIVTCFHFYLLIIYFIIVIMSLYFYWKKYSLFVDDKFLVKRTQLWTQKEQWLPIDKIQSIYIQQNVWQKKIGLGKLIVTSGGGNMSFRTGDYQSLLALCNYILYRIEKPK